MARLGMLVPSSNTCLEPVTYQLIAAAGEDITAHFTRLEVTKISLDAASTAQFAAGSMRRAACLLADAHPDAIAWNGTSGSWLGLTVDEELTAMITEITGIAATTSTLALMTAFRAFGTRQIGLITPYTADVSERIIACYGQAGMPVSAAVHLGITDNNAFAAIPAQRIAAAARTVASSGPDALAIVCTNVRGAGLAVELEAELGIPVLDSVSATFWHMLQLTGAPRSVGGWGTLLAAGPLRVRAQELCAALLAATGCDRVTLRLDLPVIGLHVDLVTAEVTRAGVRSIRHDSSLDQRRLNTVTWLEQTRRNLVQPDFAADPRPPIALIEVYGVRAQLLGPVECGHRMVGWFSAHSLCERPWSETDIEAMNQARAQASDMIRSGLAGVSAC